MLIVNEVEFKTAAEFFKSLLYSRPIPGSMVKKQYGSYENVAKTRLKINDAMELKSKLIEMRDKYRLSIDMRKKGVLELPINADVLKIFTIAFNFLDDNTKKGIIQTYATTTKKDVAYLNEVLADEINKNK